MDKDKLPVDDVARDGGSEARVAPVNGSDAQVVLSDAANVDAGNKNCMICERQQSEGLHIAGEFICLDCERELVRTDVLDEKYPFFIHQMKRVWQRKNA